MKPESGRIIEVENTPTGWERLAGKAEGDLPLTARTAIKGPLDDEQLFRLRHCFVELERLERQNRAPAPFVLQIEVQGERDAFRIQHYLAVMTALRGVKLELVFGEKRMEGQQQLRHDYYGILPLICVGVEQMPWMAHYLMMVSPGNSARVRDRVEQSFQKDPPAHEGGADSTGRLLGWLCLQNLWSLQRNLSSWAGKPGDAGRKYVAPEYTLDRQIKFCLEFSVLNDALRDSGQAPGELWGITRTFARNRDRDNWESMTLEQVFAYRCERMADIAKHYGLRLLEKTVQLNGGFFSVCSPGKLGFQERYGSFYRREVKKSCYQIPSGETCTGFDVLLPLFPHWHEMHEEREGSSAPDRLFQRESLKAAEYRQRVLRLREMAVLEAATRPARGLA